MRCSSRRPGQTPAWPWTPASWSDSRSRAAASRSTPRSPTRSAKRIPSGPGHDRTIADPPSRSAGPAGRANPPAATMDATVRSISLEGSSHRRADRAHRPSHSDRRRRGDSLGRAHRPRAHRRLVRVRLALARRTMSMTTQVTWEVEPATDGRSAVVLRHAGWAEAGLGGTDRDDHRGAWQEYVDGLLELLSGEA